MGNWQLEVFRMAVYMAFPVSMFYYFNQPDIYEYWVIKSKREIYPLIKREEEEKLKERLRRVNEIREAKITEEMEDSANN